MALLIMVSVSLTNCLEMTLSSWICLAMVIVCPIAVAESVIIMHGYPIGVISCAMAIAISSALFMHVSEVPKLCGRACILASKGVVSWFFPCCAAD